MVTASAARDSSYSCKTQPSCVGRRSRYRFGDGYVYAEQLCHDMSHAVREYTLTTALATRTLLPLEIDPTEPPLKPSACQTVTRAIGCDITTVQCNSATAVLHGTFRALPTHEGRCHVFGILVGDQVIFYDVPLLGIFSCIRRRRNLDTPVRLPCLCSTKNGIVIDRTAHGEQLEATLKFQVGEGVAVARQ